ncbi:hypothetical protein [Marivita sp. GX14005]|uniref:hypothetical protein n=1 Tax=Marivita sp. GX14005 TaxID=2942276 RepID=UPI0020196C27|nr:hypothetical protein [Marivita sp. GX14005]MCL3882759.1 hypothetical protein [Marivita sp. GX14005]
MRSVWAGIAALVVLSACGRGSLDTITHEGAVFHGDLTAERSDRASFVATGGPVSVSVEGARRAAVYQANQHCIAYLGTSDIAWARTGEDVLVADGDMLVLMGRCNEP